MSMEFDGEFDADRPRDELWEYFTDTSHLADCAPGLEEMTLISDSEFEATITVGVGSVKPSFNIEGVVVEADRPNRLVMSMEGSAGRKGAFNAVGTMDMRETEDGTLLEWKAEADVSGMIASMGQRALGSVTDRLVGQFFTCMEEKIESGVPAESEISAADDAEASIE